MNGPVVNVRLNTNTAPSAFSAFSGLPWVSIAIASVFLLVGFIVFYVQHYSLQSVIKWWKEFVFGPSSTAATATAAAALSVQDTTSPLAQLKTQTAGVATNPGETWCFLGEDNTGRWCVKVPIPSLCEPARSYGGRDPCEMTLAQQLPLGLVDAPRASLSKTT